ncbi:hypothetical protein BDD12DRAFT_807906 [Trichophaea hybrida]|nr:hypothetical protein BDD12DRAFT_807906 [Trichophaea hybrida]
MYMSIRAQITHQALPHGWGDSVNGAEQTCTGKRVFGNSAHRFWNQMVLCAKTTSPITEDLEEGEHKYHGDSKSDFLGQPGGGRDDPGGLSGPGDSCDDAAGEPIPPRLMPNSSEILSPDSSSKSSKLRGDTRPQKEKPKKSRNATRDYLDKNEG